MQWSKCLNIINNKKEITKVYFNLSYYVNRLQIAKTLLYNLFINNIIVNKSLFILDTCAFRTTYKYFW